MKNFLVCDGCGDNLSLNRVQVGQLSGQTTSGQKLVMVLEEHQLAGKNEMQRNYLRSQRAEYEKR